MINTAYSHNRLSAGRTGEPHAPLTAQPIDSVEAPRIHLATRLANAAKGAGAGALVAPGVGVAMLGAGGIFGMLYFPMMVAGALYTASCAYTLGVGSLALAASPWMALPGSALGALYGFLRTPEPTTPAGVR